MADVRYHLDYVQGQIDMLKVAAKLMLSAELSPHFEIGQHGTILLSHFANMVLSIVDTTEDELKDLDLAISMSGHEKK
jgi:hypothetical protein